MDPSHSSNSSSINKGLQTSSSSDPQRACEWSQDDDTVDVTYQLPAAHCSISKKQLHVDISSKTLSIIRKPEGGEGNDMVLLELSFFAGVKVSDSTWSRSGNCVEFALEKQQEGEDWLQLEATV